jgi:Spy/CpxP family protein refolding chaperone
MTRLRLLVVTGLVLAFIAPLSAQDKKDPPKADSTKTDTAKPDAPKARGTLPQNWKQLGLTDEQKQKVYQIQTDHRAKIDALQKQISDLRAAERKELETVLTDAQKARLKEILTNRAPASEKPAK